MVFALLAAFLFACSGVSAQRTTSMLGPIKANVLRLGFACLVLGLWTWHSGGVDFGSEAAFRLFISGATGFGLGDMALFFALPRLGARLTLLLNLCTAPVFGLLGDRLLLGTHLELRHVLCSALILLGVSQALLSRPSTKHTTGSRSIGYLAALIAGFGQGTGAVLSRWAHQAELAAGIPLPSHVETFLRVIAGLSVVSLFWLAVRQTTQHRPAWAMGRPLNPQAGIWIVLNATAGAILGVTCFQRALAEASSAVVLSITATTPILIMPMTAFTEKDRPGKRSVLGALLAVSGVVLLKLSH